ncbi:MAG: Dam family site-specific DNA-(adenine-N6)-methyltransferase [Bacteroidales bacterium]|nr:Dam family site-specific DNA-(adenine-N6)-methyltransferase [Bacteroidales bacterium]
MQYIKSPLNYTGNKYRILDQITKAFPRDINCMVDLFCGGATVGLNVNAGEVYFIDNNECVINLLSYLSKINFDEFLSRMEAMIESYGLSNSYRNGFGMYHAQCENPRDNNGLKSYNFKGYYKLRDDYNALADKHSNEANAMLYLLMVYAFNNDIRFNSSGDFNLPVGKTDLNRMNVEKIRAYAERSSSINAHFLCLDFDSAEVQEIVNKADFVYMDPPYLVGEAVYNSGWNEEKEQKLLDFIDGLLAKGKNFALSNVMGKVGKVNGPLTRWCESHMGEIEITDIEYHYRSSNYHKIVRDAKEREVVISNKVK